MNTRKIALTALTLSLLAASNVGRAQEKAAGDDLKQIAQEAYIFGYPLVTMEMTRKVMTNAATPEGTHAPMGQFVRMRSYPDAKFRDVTAPNADTLYSTAWLDLTKEPMVLSIPDMGDRYFLMPMLSGWTEVFEVPGKRTTGTKAQTYLITGPGWKGEVPKGVTQLKAPTNMVWVLGRTYCTGTPEDYKEVHALMDQYSVTPLSSYGKPYTPPAGVVDSTVDMKTGVRDQVHKMDGKAYFTLLAKLMKDNPPAEADAPLVAKMAKLGIVPGKDFDASKLDAAVAEAISEAPKPSIEKIMGHMKEAGKLVNGWTFTTTAGIYGTDYVQRAFITAVGLGANRPQDAIYPTTLVDSEGKRLNGASKYVLHFDKGQTPPADGFWSITMYDDKYYFVVNALNRYTVSSRFDFKYNQDGSLDLLIQNESPGKDKESNWLPAPKGDFILMMRLYWPSEKAPSIIDGSWKTPGVKRVD